MPKKTPWPGPPDQHSVVRETREFHGYELVEGECTAKKDAHHHLHHDKIDKERFLIGHVREEIHSNKMAPKKPFISSPQVGRS